MAKFYALGMLALILVSIALSAYFYPYLPETLPSHWNIHGQVDGYMPKFAALFVMPVISLLFLGLFMYMYKLPSFRKNMSGMQKYYEAFVFIFIAFLFYLYLLTLAWDLGYRLDVIQMLAPAFAILFYFAGSLVQHAKRNYFVGMRFPWTMKSDVVWRKTNHLGGNLLKYCGFLAVLGFFVPYYAFFFVLLPIIGLTIFLGFYSYIQDKKKHSRKL